MAGETACKDKDDERVQNGISGIFPRLAALRKECQHWCVFVMQNGPVFVVVSQIEMSVLSVYVYLFGPRDLEFDYSPS